MPRNAGEMESESGRKSSVVAAAAAPNTRCVTCENDGNIALTCEAKHKMCQDCFPTNLKRFPSSKLIYTCPRCTEATDQVRSPYVWIFADNSNMWIEAMKHAGKKFEGCEKDPRVRIDVGRLMRAVAGEREVKKATMYGSEPPPNDSVWNKMRERKWCVEIKERSAVTGKEKEVDSQLVADVTELACTTPLALQGTIIILSGDRDMCPAIKSVLKESSRWKAEMYMWKNAHTLIKRLEGFRKNYPERLSWHFFEDYLDKIWYLNREISEKKEVPSNSSAVITVRGYTPEQLIIDNDKWWEKLDSVAQWPVQYKWPLGKGDPTKHLLLVFPSMPDDKLRTLVENINNPTREFVIPHVEQCELYSKFKRKLQRRRAKPVTDEDGWATVAKRNIPKSTAAASNVSTAKVAPPSTRQSPQMKRPTVRCCSGKNCTTGLKCKFNHNKDEHNYFQRREGGVGNELRKTRHCRDHRSGRCKYPTCRCGYAHEESDRWCMNCHKSGHFRDKCTQPKCQHPSHTQSE